MSAVRHPLCARVYTRFVEGAEADLGEHRDTLVAGLSGRVIEIGVGTGINFRRYPPAVVEVVAVEPEPYLREQARKAASEAPVPVTVLDGIAEQLPVGDGEFDAAVACFVLCSVGDQGAAIREIRRVLRPGGELRFLEHVLARDPRLARTQRIVRPVWRRTCGNCHPDRDTLAAIERAGFRVERYRRFPLVACAIDALVAPHVLGVAVRPPGT